MFRLAGQTPSEGENLVAIDSSIEFFILDDGSSIDISSLKVIVNGQTAIEDVEFKDGFDGPASEITPVDENYLIVIDKEDVFEQSEVVNIKIQLKKIDGKFFNYDYAFKTVPKEPILKLSSPKNLEVVRSDKILFFHFEDIIDGIDIDSINISLDGVAVISNGSFEEDYDGLGSSIEQVEDGVYIRVDKKEPLRDGSYQIAYSVSDAVQNNLSGILKFNINLNKAVLSSVFPQASFLSGKGGIKRVVNFGDGNRLTIEWSKAISRSYRADSYVLIYENVSRLNVFDGQPRYLIDGDISAATVGGYETGLTMSFAARSLETHRNTLDSTGMIEAADNVYLIPNETSISDLVDSEDTLIPVTSTEGYPNAGVLIINNSEVIRYISKTDNSFLLPPGGRGLNNTTADVHVSGDEVRMFLACQDSNTAIVMATPHFDSNTQSGREINNVGLVVTDYSDNDRKFFQGYDFCGYHRAMPQNTLSGKDDCGSYLGGEFNGMRGMNLFDRMLNREEVLLDQVGEPVVLLRRLWDGEKCSCSTSRRNNPKVKGCKKCFGTGYLGGYSQFINRRRQDTRTMVQFGDTKEDLKLGPHQHLEQDYEPQCWTLPTPAIRDRDLIIRFDFNDDIEYIYEVLDTTKDKLFFRHFTRQKLSLKRLDKTDIVYTFRYTLEL